MKGRPPDPLAEAAATAKVPLEEVERAAAGYRSWLALERQGCSLNDARHRLARLRKAAAALRRATYLPPIVTALSGIEGAWPQTAARAAETAAELDRLAAAAGRRLEDRAQGYIAGGNGNLAHLIAEPAKLRLVRELAALLPPGAATSTPTGRFAKLVAAVHAGVTGQAARGVSHAIRKVGIARTCQEKRSSRKDTAASLKDTPASL